MTNHNNLYINQLTNLPNFISFMLSNFKKNFGSQGFIVYFEVASLSYINKDYGYDIGDIILRKTSEELSNFNSIESSTNLYHIGGDTFTLISQSDNRDELEIQIENIKVNLCKILKDYEIVDLKYHSSIVEYHKEISSVEEFYQHLYNNPAEDGRYQSKFWVFDIS